MFEPTLTNTPECAGSQTVGPYYAIGLDHLVSEVMAGPLAQGDHLTISGTVFDADGEPVPDAILELWQATPEGRYNETQELGEARTLTGFLGFSRLSTHAGGTFHVDTVLPGSVPYLDERVQAPHIVVLAFMRGLMRHLVTRVYFPSHPLNVIDPVLQLVPPERRHTLIAKPAGGNALQWNIYLQGPEETVFFAC